MLATSGRFTAAGRRPDLQREGDTEPAVLLRAMVIGFCVAYRNAKLNATVHTCDSGRFSFCQLKLGAARPMDLQTS